MKLVGSFEPLGPAVGTTTGGVVGAATTGALVGATVAAGVAAGAQALTTMLKTASILTINQIFLVRNILFLLLENVSVKSSIQYDAGW
ncbi:MAG TPA: hypothetical protein VFF70_01615 [Anaerolineae bacterium]|nr:hypothetical protein [Anaerolineae bacterium]